LKQRIFFRADGNSTIGLGHVVRTLALVDILKEDFECVFVIQNPQEYLKNEILKICDSIIQLDNTSEYTKEAVYIAETFLKTDDIVVLDGYNFKTEYQINIKRTGVKLVCIDDLHSWHFVADIIINQNPAINPSFYSKESYTKLFIGFDFLLLRKPFREEIKKSRVITKIENAFICIGGTDPGNITKAVLIAALEKNYFKKINVVTGGAYKHLESLQQLIASNSGQIKHYSNLTATEMVATIKSSEFAIAPASSISMELMCIGINLLTGYFVDNQKEFSNYLHNSSLGVTVGDFNIITEKQFNTYITQNLYNDTYKTQKKVLSSVDTSKLSSIFKQL